MHLHLRPEGVALTEAQAKALDDEFFLARPMAHFSSRIAGLLEANKGASSITSESDPEFFAALGLVGADDKLAHSDRERKLQVSIDAVALRHQAAEALIRFLFAVSAAEPRGNDAPSTWVAVADSPTNLSEVIRRTNEALDRDRDDDVPRFVHHLYPTGTLLTEELFRVAETAAAWANHAIRLLTHDELSINAAHNKVKHGLAISARDDVRIEMIPGPIENPAQIPLSAFGPGRSVPIFDRPLLTFLGRSSIAKPKQGLEAVSLRVDVPVVLAEAWMFADIYAAFFHSAAKRHFGVDSDAKIAPFPGLIANRLPEHVLGADVLGFRSPVTMPPDGTSEPRPAGLFFYGTFLPMDIDFDGATSGQIVDG